MLIIILPLCVRNNIQIVMEWMINGEKYSGLSGIVSF